MLDLLKFALNHESKLLKKSKKEYEKMINSKDEQEHSIIFKNVIMMNYYQGKVDSLNSLLETIEEQN